MAAYLNSDGLYIKTGQTEGLVGNTGEFNIGGNDHWVETRINLTSLGSSAAIVDDNNILPINARIREVHVISDVAAVSGGGGALNFGLIRTDRTTLISSTGLIAAQALATLSTVGTETVLRVGSTGAGTLIGTTLAFPALITAHYTTAAFTAGRVIVRVRWYRP